MRKVTVFICWLIISSTFLIAQQTTRSPASFDFNDNGIVFSTADTNLKVVMRFRMQNQFTYNTVSDEDFSAASSELAIRRMRLRFGGFLYKNFTFNIQLGFARRDWDADDSDVPNIIRDAMAFWNFSKNLQIGFGQTKLPGNRQRVVSSGDLQFADRSIVNSRFSLDRDFGFQGFYGTSINNVFLNFRGAISNGDGRYTPQMKGFNLAYTGRIEVLPFGLFKDGGDYFEGDLSYETTPKLSVGAAYSYNEKATRTRGQLGGALFSPRDQASLIADAIFKYKGFALYGEYANRTSNDPITRSSTGDIEYVYAGSGYLIQASYFVSPTFEIAARLADVNTDDELAGLPGAEHNRHITSSFNYYIHKHRAKAQIEITNNMLENNATGVQKTNWIGRLNVELGI